MRSVAERAFAALPAPAERNRGFAFGIELVAVFVEQFKLAFEANWSIIFDDDFCCHNARVDAPLGQ